LLITGLKGVGSREGNDAQDAQGNEYELKSVNTSVDAELLDASSHESNHPCQISEGGLGVWLFMRELSCRQFTSMKPTALEPYFSKWESKWHESGGKDINNPKIPVKFVVEHGELVYQKPQE
jgi:hypothetical protein